MIIAVYTSEDPAIAPNRRGLAQFEKLKNRLYINFYGATHEEARQKAQAFWDTEVLPKARSAAQRAAEESADPDDDLLGDPDDDLLGDLL